MILKVILTEHKGGENIQKQKISKQKNYLMFAMVLIGLFVIFSYGMGNVSAASGDSIYVNGSSGNDAYNGLNSTWTSGLNGPKATIGNATGTVTTNGTIYIAKGTYNESNIQINTNMTIIGENQKNTIINGQKSGQSIFTITSGVNVTIINLTFTNGTSNLGGAIYNDGGTLTDTNDTFNNNTATNGYGGAIFNNGGTLTETNDTFNNNTATNGFGGAIYNNVGTLTETNDTFNNNTATNSFGGAIFNYGGTVTETNDTFNKNSAYDGGAIYNGGVTVTETNDTFNNNSAYDGGAIYNGGGTLTDTNDTFNNNTANGDGGAIINYGGTLTVDNTTFTNNTANGFGGAICNIGTATVNFNRIIGNTASSGNAISNNYGTVDARYNWWGSNTNPSANISGSDVTYDPWIVLTVTANLTTINFGGKSNITADLLHDSNGVYHDPVNGHVPDGLTVNFSSDTKGTINPIISTITNGSTNTTFTGLQPGVSVVSAMVDDQTVPTNVNINKISTAITVTPVNGLNGKTVNLTATLTDSDGNPVSGASVQFSVNGTIIGSVNTDTNGIATVPYTITQTSETYTIQANYLGNNTYAASNNTNNLTVNKTPTTITVDPIHNYPSQSVNLTAHVNDYYNNPVNGGQVNYTVNNIDAGTATVINGIATLSWTIPNNWNVGNYTITATYDGTGTNYVNSTNSSTLTIDQTPTTITVDPIHNYPSQSVNLTAHVNDYYNNPVNGGQVNYTVNNIDAGTATVINGIATLSWTIPNNWNVGNYTITATYDGTGTNYVNSTNSSTLTIDQTPTNITVKPVTGIDNQTVTLNAKLTDTYGNLLAVQTVIFSVNGHNYSAVTGNNGIATINYIPYGAGNYDVTVNYLGNDNYTDSQGSGLLKVNPSAYLYLQITASNKNPKVGETFTITYKLGNKGPDNATNVTITIPLPSSFIVSNITGDGNWTYNTKTNTITWTLTNVPVGDPNLYITGKTINSGVYVFGSSISSETYNLNTEGITPIIINTTKNSTNPVTPKNSTTILNADTNTIPMQHTGIPIVGLIFGILSVIGGSVMSRKK